MKTNLTNHAFRFLSIFLITSSSMLFGQVTNTNTALTYATIQAAIDAEQTLDGHTLNISAGTYVENILVNKELTIQGPQAGIDGNDATRGTGEAIVHPASINFTDGVFWASGGKILNITADNVTIDGLTLDGDNPNLVSGYVLNGADIDCESGISSHGGYAGDDPDLAGDNLVIKNNIIKNLMGYGVIMWSAASLPTSQSAQIYKNKLQNILFIGIHLSQDYYATIQYNKMSELPVGASVYLFYGANTSSNPGRINNNTIITKVMERNDGYSVTALAGIQMIFLYNGITNAWEVSENAIDNSLARSIGSQGIVVSHCEGQALSVNNNTITNFENGYLLHSSVNFWTPGAPAAVNGGTVSNCTNGVTVINLSEWVGDNPSDHYQVNGLTIQNSSVAGVFVASQNINYESGFGANTPTKVSVDVSNCKIIGGPAGIFNEGNWGYAEVHNNELSDNTSFAIQNLSTNLLNATCNWYGHWTGPTNTGNTGGMGGNVTGNVKFEPWLVNGTDNDGTMAGFQPVSGSCILIKCGNNNNKYLLCHKDKTLCVGYEDALIHLNHGDGLGECLKNSNYDFSSGQVSEGSDGLQVMVSPNPSTSNFELYTSSSIDATIEVKVFDVNGRLICQPVISYDQITKFGNDFPRGIFLVQVRQGEILKTIKIIKQ